MASSRSVHLTLKKDHLECPISKQWQSSGKTQHRMPPFLCGCRNRHNYSNLSNVSLTHFQMADDTGNGEGWIVCVVIDRMGEHGKTEDSRS
ncbi:hypothetical protein AVEN_59141-1 [Araneus ventricosus]|uniref:Uncharacterized protein n=1 Tax=Araneus ventricosus TaxID=182803 RepID=A0A4Y2QU92_ARAVE|nr:hypothetical protein AVEN_59141-1 [Araneus ventricosus]